MDEYFRCVELPITIEEFHRLPRNAAYKYEYFGGRAVLSPRPKSFTCVRDLSPVEAEPDPLHQVEIRPLTAGEAPGLAGLFSAAVRRTQPFESLDTDAAEKATAACFDKALSGGDGPIIEPAWFQAFDTRHEQAAGAILITLVPHRVLTDPFAGNWKESPPPDAVARKLGVPHLTWVFVHPWEGRHGVGTALLAASVAALREMGFEQLASTFMLDNGPSALWHWRNGFRLLSQMALFRKKWHERHPG